MNSAILSRSPFGLARTFLRNTTCKRGFTSAAYKNVSASEASEMMKSGTKYLDVRTVDEFVAGRPPGSINLPVLGAGMVPNAQFMSEVSVAFTDKTESIIVGCKAGRRSLTAIQLLSQAGYINLVNQEGGWDGWVSSGLPVEK